MPTYQYACTDCGHRFEAVQSFSDDALTACPECGGALRKVYGSVGVVFKGSGFYRTDSRSNSKSAATAAAKSSAESGSTSSSGESSSSSAAASSTKPAGSASTTSTASTPAKAAAS